MPGPKRWRPWLLALLGLGLSSSLQAAPRHCEVSFEQGARLYGVPLADTPDLQQQGLSRRDDVSSGMWFDFPQPQWLRFWMHETRQPLSIAFIDADGVLFQIEDMTPLSLQVHAASRPAQAALELPAGDFARLGVVPGQRVWRQNCR